MGLWSGIASQGNWPTAGCAVGMQGWNCTCPWTPPPHPTPIGPGRGEAVIFIPLEDRYHEV